MLNITLAKHRRWLLPLAIISLTACGLTQTVSDGTSAAVKSLFSRQIKTLHLDFSARESLNSDSREHAPLSEPVMVRVYQLRQRQTVDKAFYHQLLHDGDDMLKADTLASRDVVVTPGGAVALDEPLEAETQYIAIIALFRQPNRAKNSWRRVLARDELHPDRPRVIELDSNSLQLK